MLSGIMIEAGQGSGMTLNFDTVNEDASKILTEAATVAEQKIKDKFPDLPPGMPSSSSPASQAEKTTF
jgi:division protein CdvB (Snf7/Vps24/ESCRT-III family)